MTSKRVELRQAVADPTRQWVMAIGVAAAVLIVGWREMDGPPVEAPSQKGYGTNLICDLIPYELGGTVDLAFSSGGVTCTIGIPLKTGAADVA